MNKNLLGRKITTFDVKGTKNAKRIRPKKNEHYSIAIKEKKSEKMFNDSIQHLNFKRISC